MGLDMYLFKKKKDIKSKIISELTGEDGKEEVIYWRKCYDIHEWFGNLFGEMENCKDYKVTKEDLEKFIEWLKNEQEVDENIKYDEEECNEYVGNIQEIINKTDWDKESIIYWAWW